MSKYFAIMLIWSCAVFYLIAVELPAAHCALCPSAPCIDTNSCWTGCTCVKWKMEPLGVCQDLGK